MPPISFAVLPIIFWGSSFLATKLLLQNHFSPMLISFIRFLIVSIILSLFPNNKNNISKKDIKYFLIMGILGITLFYYFENTGLKFTTIANTSLITATIPLFTLLYASIFLKKKMLVINILGIPLSLLGTWLLFHQDIAKNPLHIKGDIFVFVSVFLWIAYSFAYDKVSDKYSQIIIVRNISIIGTITMLPFVINDIINPDNLIIDFKTVISFAYLSIVCTLLAYLLWNTAIKKLGIKITSNLILFIPIISVSTGILFWDEKFTFNIVWATILIIFGSYFTSKRAKNYEF